VYVAVMPLLFIAVVVAESKVSVVPLRGIDPRSSPEAMFELAHQACMVVSRFAFDIPLD